MLCRRNTACLRHYSLSLLSSPLYLLSSPFSAPLRCTALRERQARSRRDLVTLLPVMSRVRSTFLSAPVAPPALLRRETRTREHTHTHTYYTPIYLLPCRVLTLFSFFESPVSLTLPSSLSSSFLCLSFFLHFFPYRSLACSRSRYRFAGTRRT